MTFEDPEHYGHSIYTDSDVVCIYVSYTDLQVSLSGGSTLQKYVGEEVVLQPNAIDPDSESTALSYQWSAICASSGCQGTQGLQTTSNYLNIPANTENAGCICTYTFVASDGASGRSATVALNITWSASPVVETSVHVLSAHKTSSDIVQVNPSNKIRLRASANKTTSGSELSYSWTLVGVNDLSYFTTTPNFNYLTIGKNKLSYGTTYIVQVDTSDQAFVGQATLKLQTYSQPTGGTCMISPQWGGIALENVDYTVTCTGWVDGDGFDQDLRYKVDLMYRDSFDDSGNLITGSTPRSELVLRQASTSSIVSGLDIPVGNATRNYTHVLRVSVMSYFGAIVHTDLLVQVLQPTKLVTADTINAILNTTVSTSALGGSTAVTTSLVLLAMNLIETNEAQNTGTVSFEDLVSSSVTQIKVLNQNTPNTSAQAIPMIQTFSRIATVSQTSSSGNLLSRNAMTTMLSTSVQLMESVKNDDDVDELDEFLSVDLLNVVEICMEQDFVDIDDVSNFDEIVDGIANFEAQFLVPGEELRTVKTSNTEMKVGVYNSETPNSTLEFSNLDQDIIPASSLYIDSEILSGWYPSDGTSITFAFITAAKDFQSTASQNSKPSLQVSNETQAGVTPILSLNTYINSQKTQLVVNPLATSSLSLSFTQTETSLSGSILELQSWDKTAGVWVKASTASPVTTQIAPVSRLLSVSENSIRPRFLASGDTLSTTVDQGGTFRVASVVPPPPTVYKLTLTAFLGMWPILALLISISVFGGPAYFVKKRDNEVEVSLVTERVIEKDQKDERKAESNKEELAKMPIKNVKLVYDKKGALKLKSSIYPQTQKQYGMIFAQAAKAIKAPPQQAKTRKAFSNSPSSKNLGLLTLKKGQQHPTITAPKQPRPGGVDEEDARPPRRTDLSTKPTLLEAWQLAAEARREFEAEKAREANKRQHSWASPRSKSGKSKRSSVSPPKKGIFGGFFSRKDSRVEPISPAAKSSDEKPDAATLKSPVSGTLTGIEIVPSPKGPHLDKKTTFGDAISDDEQKPTTNGDGFGKSSPESRGTSGLYFPGENGVVLGPNNKLPPLRKKTKRGRHRRGGTRVVGRVSGVSQLAVAQGRGVMRGRGRGIGRSRGRAPVRGRIMRGRGMRGRGMRGRGRGLSLEVGAPPLEKKDSKLIMIHGSPVPVVNKPVFDFLPGRNSPPPVRTTKSVRGKTRRGGSLYAGSRNRSPGVNAVEVNSHPYLNGELLVPVVSPKRTKSRTKRGKRRGGGIERASMIRRISELAPLPQSPIRAMSIRGGRGRGRIRGGRRGGRSSAIPALHSASPSNVVHQRDSKHSPDAKIRPTDRKGDEKEDPMAIVEEEEADGFEIEPQPETVFDTKAAIFWHIWKWHPVLSVLSHDSDDGHTGYERLCVLGFTWSAIMAVSGFFYGYDMTIPDVAVAIITVSTNIISLMFSALSLPMHALIKWCVSCMSVGRGNPNGKDSVLPPRPLR
eukprot:jgi/Bigna1/132047/aug1.16_g6755